MVFNTMLKFFFIYIMAVSFIRGENRIRYPEKTTDLPQVTDNFYHVMITPHLSRIRTHNVSGNRH